MNEQPAQPDAPDRDCPTLGDRARDILWPVMVAAVVATLWTHAWCQSLVAQANRGYYGANDPTLIKYATAAAPDGPAVPVAR